MDKARKYLKSLNWDGIERLDNWISPLKKYNSFFIKSLFKPVIEFVFNSHTTIEKPILLKGKQGCGKSRFIKDIAGEKLFNNPIVEAELGDNKREYISKIPIWTTNQKCTFDDFFSLDMGNLDFDFVESIRDQLWAEAITRHGR